VGPGEFVSQDTLVAIACTKTDLPGTKVSVRFV